MADNAQTIDRTLTYVEGFAIVFDFGFGHPVLGVKRHESGLNVRFQRDTGLFRSFKKRDIDGVVICLFRR